MGSNGMDRRHFLKVSGAAAAVAGGVITALLGGPFFLWLLVRKR